MVVPVAAAPQRTSEGSDALPRRVTVVMYHFVRDLRHSRYPAIKGRDAADFAGQLAYILRHHRVVRMEDVVAASRDPAAELPERALLLTFDDGYADHYDTVFPLLDRLGLQGSFFVPARAVLEGCVLDVNKIHFLLATVTDAGRLVRAMEARIEAARNAYALEPVASYRAAHVHANRWDPAEVIYVKRVLQKGLPAPLRAAIVDELFREFVTADEGAFARELYVSLEQLQCMWRHGMHVGGHGHDHVWLDTLDHAGQTREVRGSMELLRRVGCDLLDWTIAYPYGGFDASLTSILAASGCTVGFTTELAVADLGVHRALELPRIDTNDLPVRPDAPPVRWSRRDARGRRSS